MQCVDDYLLSYFNKSLMISRKFYVSLSYLSLQNISRRLLSSILIPWRDKYDDVCSCKCIIASYVPFVRLLYVYPILVGAFNLSDARARARRFANSTLIRLGYIRHNIPPRVHVGIALGGNTPVSGASAALPP